MIKPVLAFLSEKPLIGAATGIGGGLAAFLTKIQMLTPVIGFFAAIVGLLVGLATLLLKIRELYEVYKKDHRKNKIK